MDIQRPELDGLEATGAIRASPAGAGLRIVAVTAHASAGDKERCLAAGMDDYLSKPFKARHLFMAVEGWMDPAAASAPGSAPVGPPARLPGGARRAGRPACDCHPRAQAST